MNNIQFNSNQTFKKAKIQNKTHSEGRDIWEAKYYGIMTDEGTNRSNKALAIYFVRN